MNIKFEYNGWSVRYHSGMGFTATKDDREAVKADTINALERLLDSADDKFKKQNRPDPRSAIHYGNDGRFTDVTVTSCEVGTKSLWVKSPAGSRSKQYARSIFEASDKNYALVAQILDLRTKIEEAKAKLEPFNWDDFKKAAE